MACRADMPYWGAIGFPRWALAWDNIIGEHSKILVVVHSTMVFLQSNVGDA